MLTNTWTMGLWCRTVREVSQHCTPDVSRHCSWPLLSSSQHQIGLVNVLHRSTWYASHSVPSRGHLRECSLRHPGCTGCRESAVAAERGTQGTALPAPPRRRRGFVGVKKPRHPSWPFRCRVVLGEDEGQVFRGDPSRCWTKLFVTASWTRAREPLMMAEWTKEWVTLETRHKGGETSSRLPTQFCR